MKKNSAYIIGVAIVLLIIGGYVFKSPVLDSGQKEPIEYGVYSFSGESEALELTGGTIVIDGVNSSISYDDVVYKDNANPKIVSLDQEIIAKDRTLMSNGYENKAGSQLAEVLNQGHSKSLKGDLGIVSEDLDYLIYKVTYTDMEGKETEISIDLKVKQTN